MTFNYADGLMFVPEYYRSMRIGEIQLVDKMGNSLILDENDKEKREIMNRANEIMMKDFDLNDDEFEESVSNSLNKVLVRKRPNLVIKRRIDYR